MTCALFGGEGSHMITCSILIEWLPVGKGSRRIRPDSPLLETTGIRLLTTVKTNNTSIISESEHNQHLSFSKNRS